MEDGTPVYIVMKAGQQFPYGVYTNRHAAAAEAEHLHLCGIHSHVIIQILRHKPQYNPHPEGEEV